MKASKYFRCNLDSLLTVIEIKLNKLEIGKEI
jgi:hypothetical protein